MRAAYTPKRFDIKVNITGYKPSGVAVLKGARIISMKGDEILDHVLLTCFPAPHSLTGEDVV